MALEKTRNDELIMICDCNRSGADWDASDLPIIALKCDGRCDTRTVVVPDKEKITRYRQYIKEGVEVDGIHQIQEKKNDDYKRI